ncbi:copper resistance protein CopC [Streptomyces sp. MUM 136J]|uniref:copper resistance CopC/CopD family protein n=1 Tax=Streptomyces sp. MUM 136J TaxID=2791992 RepID=UPI0027E3C425|nr:copper resistance protein CopC [Streptomyces sp. MUM 136J]
MVRRRPVRPLLRRLARGATRTPAALLTVAAFVALFLLGGGAPAAAHAVMTGSDPREGTVLRTAPRQVTVTFDEPVALVESSLRVLDPDNRPVTAGDPIHADGKGDTARVRLTDGLGRGTYTVSWRVVSADGHAVSGAFTFSYGEPSGTRASATTPAVDPVVRALHGTARYAAYAGLALLIGATVFVLACRPAPTAARTAHRLATAGWWILLASTALLLLLRGPYDSGDGASGALDPGLLGHTASSRPGIALLARLALLLAVALPARNRQPVTALTRRSAAAAALWALALAATWAAADHAAVGIQVPVAVAASMLHLGAMAVWLGGLAALLTALYRAPAAEPLPPTAVARFSRLAMTAVAVLAVTGVYQSWRGLGSVEALFTTGYGRILAFKAWAVLLMLAVAWHSRRHTGRLLRVPGRERTPVTVGGGAPAAPPDRGAGGVPLPEGEAPNPAPGPHTYRRRLRRCVLAEAAVGVVVLALSTVLTGSQPGRAATEAAAVRPVVPGQPDVNLTMIPFNTGSTALAGRGRVQITLEPGRVGRNVVEAVVYGADGSPVTVPELRLTLTLRDRRVGPLDAHLADEGGYWGSDTLELPVAGTWTMRATVRTSDIDQVTVERTVRIGP